jgi:hypothetical protein
MRKYLITIIRILDGAPVRSGKRQSGQSVVELALITPILIIMLVGLTEIGWFANNYLNLLDVTRAGARRATTFTDQLSPLAWDNRGSYVPNLWADTPYEMPETTDNGTDAERLLARSYDPVTGGCTQSIPNVFDTIGFYDSVVCIMLRSMPPIRITDNGVDDIVVSAFGLARINPAENDPADPGGSDPPWLGANRPMQSGGVPLDIPQMVVVSRYPTNANECDVTLDSAGVAQLTPLEPRDPFDFNENTQIDRNPTASERPVDPLLNEIENEFNEIEGYDAPESTIAEAEKQVGFSWFGNNVIEDTQCIGSEWTMARIERLMNLPSFTLDSPFGTADQSRREMMPNQGVVVVEMFWQHRLLLNLPFFTALGETPVIRIWAAFPLPTTEPFIVFG